MKRFLTHYEKEGFTFSGEDIQAYTWDEAQKIADERGLGEKVIGYVPR